MADGPFLAELAEADAPEEIAAIYRAIRHWSGVPMVALIFRHLATHDGVLPELWQGFRPLLETGAVQETAWRIAAAQVPGDLMPAVGRAAREAAGLDEAATDVVCRTIDAYNRANPVNLLVMLTVGARLARGEAAAVPPGPRAWTPPAPIAVTMPPMTPPARMPPALRALVRELASPGVPRPDTALPSLYRHMTGWPALLVAINVGLRPRFRDGRIATAAGVLRAALAVEAERLAEHLPPLPRLAATPSAQAAIAGFASTLIPEMVVVGHALRRALDPSQD